MREKRGGGKLPDLNMRTEENASNDHMWALMTPGEPYSRQASKRMCVVLMRQLEIQILTE